MNERVFKEGPSGLEFVGNFEQLYKEQEDPWDQSGRGNSPMAHYYAKSRNKVLSALIRYDDWAEEKDITNGLEIGCGCGYLARMTGFDGLDVSENAIKTAQLIAGNVWPNAQYFVGNILSEELPVHHAYDVVLWGQMLWYVLQDLKGAVNRSLRLCERGGLFMVSQGFLSPGKQRYGREVIDGFNGLVHWLSQHPSLQILEATYDETKGLPLHDGLVICRHLP